LALALDEPTNEDAVQEMDGLMFVMEAKLLEQAAPVKIDVSYMGFSVESNLQLGGGGCGGSCSTGSCG